MTTETEVPVNYIQEVTADLAARLPGCDARLLGLYALLVLTSGEQTTWEQVHDAWSISVDAVNPLHRSLIPFPALAPDVQALDGKYADAIRACAAARRANDPAPQGDLWRKRPVTVGARQFTAGSGPDVAAWCGGWTEEIPGGSVILHVPTQRGVVPAYDEDWVIRGCRGYWVVERDDFPATYEPAGEPAP